LEGINKKLLIVIQGPTASGKTGLSVELAKHLNTDVISADSRQFYKEMSIGTAKPSEDEMNGVAHHFIDFTSLENPINVSQYAEMCSHRIQAIFETKNYLVMTGGSGQFIDAVINGLDDIPVYPSIQNQLQSFLTSNGFEALRADFSRLDPMGFERTDNLNPRRVLRAMEVFMGSSKSIVEFQKSPRTNDRFTAVRFSIEWKREDLYNRINQRVDDMISMGLEQEVFSLLPQKDSAVFNTVGYKEWIPYFEGVATKEEVISRIKQYTRNYAKRQTTWLNKYPDLQLLNPYASESLCEQLLKYTGSDNI
jgi:tRNA dimethylallyltransferase